MRKISMKNYIIALVISLFTVLLVFNLMNIYNKRDTKVNFLNEIKEADLDYYIAENTNVIIFMSSGKKSKDIEKQFKKYLDNKDLKDNIIYVDLNEISNKFNQNFSNKYVPKKATYKLEITDPTMMLIENGQMTDWINNIKDFNQIKEFIEGSSIK